MTPRKLLIISALLTLSSTAIADTTKWFTRPYVGLSQMSNLSAEFNNIDGLSGDANITLDGGFTAGIGLGYRYDQSIAIEFGWEYRSNESGVILADTSTFDEGNYASNIFYLNGHYTLAEHGPWQPYIGAGLTWAQEIDIDLERNNEERSYSGDGELGYQLFAGINYDMAKHWKLQPEFRYSSITDLALSGEDNTAGGFSRIDYKTITLQVGLVFEF